MVIQHLGIGGWTCAENAPLLAFLLRTFAIPRAVCIYAVEAYGEGLYLAMKEQADLETRSMGRYGKPGRMLKIEAIDAASYIQLPKESKRYFKPVSLPDKKHVRKCDHTVRMASDFAKHKPLSQQRCSW